MPLGINVLRPRTAKPRKPSVPTSRSDDKVDDVVDRVRPGPAPSTGQFIAMARQALGMPTAV